VRADPYEIREETVRDVLLVLRAKVDRNPAGAVILLNALRNRLLAIPAVVALPDPWVRLPLNIRVALDQPSRTAYTLIEDDVIDLAKRAEEKRIDINITDDWEEEALKL
jgi:hypothetical protein